MEIEFFGAAGTVTGSRYLLRHGDLNLLVDCGLFQGLKTLRLRNWEPFPFDPQKIHAVILTHAHIDHSGYIPRLIKEGFRGKIYSTAATRDLCKILLPDCGHIMEEEAEYLNRHKTTKHRPALPLFTQSDGERSIRYFESVGFEEKTAVAPDVSFTFRYGGHILGAATVVIEWNGRKIAFTGDVGRMNDRVFFPPAPLPLVDYLITESTYGNRLHRDIDPLDELAHAVNAACRRKGVILIPSFAVGRAQTLMYYLWLLRKEKRIPDFPMFLNSPMAMDASDLFCSYHKLHKLSEQETVNTCSVLKYVSNVEESKGLNDRKGPMLIISASGMLTGGRVLHHLKAFAPDPKNMILLTGYQAAGTRGEALGRGASELKIHGAYVPVRAEVRVLDNMSAHADYKEMIEWFTLAKIKPRRVFVTHGEPSAADEFRRRLTETFRWNVSVPEHGERITLD